MKTRGRNNLVNSHKSESSLDGNIANPPRKRRLRTQRFEYLHDGYIDDKQLQNTSDIELINKKRRRMFKKSQKDESFIKNNDNFGQYSFSEEIEDY